MEKELHYTTQIVTDEEFRKEVLATGMNEEEFLNHLISINPPKFHKRCREIVKEVFHPEEITAT